MNKRGSERKFSQEGRALTRATIRAADRLNIPQRTLAAIIGVSEPVVSRMRQERFALERHKGKGFELALLFVRLAVHLNTNVEGDLTAARTWLTSENLVLQGRPLDLIQSVQGLVGAVRYLESRSDPGR